MMLIARKNIEIVSKAEGEQNAFKKKSPITDAIRIGIAFLIITTFTTGTAPLLGADVKSTKGKTVPKQETKQVQTLSDPKITTSTSPVVSKTTNTFAETKNKMPIKPVSECIKNLKDKDECVRMNAITMLGVIIDNTDPSMLDKSIIPALIKALKDDDDYVRFNAMLTIQKLKVKDKVVIKALKRALKDKDQSIKETAIFALEDTKDKSIIPIFIKILNDKNESEGVQKVIVAVFERIDDENNAILFALVDKLIDKETLDSIREPIYKALDNLLKTKVPRTFHEEQPKKVYELIQDALDKKKFNKK